MVVSPRAHKCMIHYVYSVFLAFCEIATWPSMVLTHVYRCLVEKFPASIDIVACRPIAK
jgi:hypothetical protein